MNSENQNENQNQGNQYEHFDFFLSQTNKIKPKNVRKMDIVY